ncbi:MAG: LamG-like jellyroll fold domain-containing protein, partial [Bryobacteraceae bacterium]
AAGSRRQTKWEHHLVSAQHGTATVRERWAPTRDSLATFLSDAASFDGKADIDTGINTPLDIDDPFTISARIYSGATPDGSVVSEMVDNPHVKGFGLHMDHGKVHVNLTSVWVDDAIRVESEETLAANRWYHLTATYDGSKIASHVRIYVDGQLAKSKVLMDTLYRPYRNGRRKFTMPVRIGGGWGPEHRFQGRIGSVHLYSTVLSGEEIAALADPDSLSTLAAKKPASRTATENNILRWSFLDTSAPTQDRESWRKLAALRADKEKFERTFPTVMVMADVPKRRETHMLVRGAYDKPGDVVQPGVPAVLNPLPANAPNNRLGFAEWVVDPANPLLSRVTVNRFWQMYFGTGIVKSVEDFGSQGDYP